MLICLLVGFAVWVGGADGAISAQTGTSGGDVLVGSGSVDALYGKGGADTLRGFGRGDVLVGGSGADTLECGSGYDWPQGGHGEDLIVCSALDGKEDVIACGPGLDTVFWSARGTELMGCENVFRVTGPGD